MPTEGMIVDIARDKLPLTFDALEKASQFGESAIVRRVESVKVKLFGEVISDDIEKALDRRVLDYAGILVALDLIGPGIDYWGKQPLSIGATGRNENKAYGARQQDLRELRAMLLEESRLMWPEVEALLPRRRVKRVSNVPRVQDIQTAFTPSPYDMDPPFGPKVG